jgi:hypothetical protein
MVFYIQQNNRFKIFNKEDESENFIPWGRKPAEQFDCDVNTQTGRKNFLSSRERWPDAKIPYEISATYSTGFFNFKGENNLRTTIF